ncbi:hypothetical protein [Croceibacterium mercuriale]|uniref:hypothetical protein n=1 Tax=Croceibacterium mercuriale TaxID=1572751 RepID=UPI000A59DB89|nr:hypothetical protein [Croceibacterium mercuriale]
MATLPPDPYAPDPARKPDGTPVPEDMPETLPGPDNPEPPRITPDRSGDDVGDTPDQGQA